MNVAHDPNNVHHMGDAPGRCRAAMIMLHGRGAGPQNILELVPLIDPGRVAYFAPQAEGHTWYPFSFLSDIPKNEPQLSSALHMLSVLVDRIVAQGVTRDRIVLLGFSQGACLSGEFAVRNAGRYGGIAMLSGGLIGPPGTRWDHEPAFDGTPVFLGCSDVDPHIPRERVEESAGVFTRMGAEVTVRIYPGMGHLVNADELQATRGLLDAVVGRAGDRGRP